MPSTKQFSNNSMSAPTYGGVVQYKRYTFTNGALHIVNETIIDTLQIPEGSDVIPTMCFAIFGDNGVAPGATDKVILDLRAHSTSTLTFTAGAIAPGTKVSPAEKDVSFSIPPKTAQVLSSPSFKALGQVDIFVAFIPKA